MIDLSHKMGRQLMSSVNSSKSLKKEIDELKAEVEAGMARCTDKENEIQKIKHELQEWECGTKSTKKKGRRGTGVSEDLWI